MEQSAFFNGISPLKTTHNETEYGGEEDGELRVLLQKICCIILNKQEQNFFKEGFEDQTV